MKPILVYEDYSNTIRQSPQNYLVAHQIDGKWTTHDIDLAVNTELAVRVFLELLNFESRYNCTGLELLAKVTPNSKFTQKRIYERIGWIFKN